MPNGTPLLNSHAHDEAYHENKQSSLSLATGSSYSHYSQYSLGQLGLSPSLPADDPSMKVTCRLATQSREVVLELPAHATVSDLKALLASQQPPFPQCRIFYGGRTLQDHDALDALGLVPGAFIVSCDACMHACMHPPTVETPLPHSVRTCPGMLHAHLLPHPPTACPPARVTTPTLLPACAPPSVLLGSWSEEPKDRRGRQ